jgi:hypothetical protein
MVAWYEKMDKKEKKSRGRRRSKGRRRDKSTGKVLAGRATRAAETEKQVAPPPQEPVVLDFSPAAIRRQVVREAIQKPYVLYPIATAILGGVAALLLGPSTLFLGAAIAGSLVGAGAWLIDTTLRKEAHVARHLSRLRQILAERVTESIHNLERDLKAVGSLEGLDQLVRLQAKYTTFEELLRGKLNKNELTYDRYLGMTEQVYLAGLDNLNSIAAIKKSISAMDLDHIRKRGRELAQLVSPSSAEKKELAALKERHQLRKSQEEKISILLSQNEEAMTTMDRLMAALAEMNPGLSRATMGMEDAMDELERLAERSRDY